MKIYSGTEDRNFDTGFDTLEIETRVSRVKRGMLDADIDLLILSDLADIQYMTGARDVGGGTPMALILPLDGEATLVGRKIDVAAFRPQCRRVNVLEYEEGESVVEAMVSAVRRYAGRECRIGTVFTNRSWSSAFVEELRIGLAIEDWADASNIVWSLCSIKSERELAHMTTAAHIASRALSDTLTFIQAGKRDCDVAGMLMNNILKAGSHMPTGYFQVASGSRTAVPHVTHDGTEIKKQDHLLLLFSPNRYRYNAPLMRTIVVGESTQEIRELYSAARSALLSAMESMRPGVKSREVHAAADSALDKFGVKHLRPHRTGYMVGASPMLTGWPQGHIMNLRAADESVLKAGMTFHLPIVLYLPRVAGVGVSETVLVGDDGGRRLGDAPLDLIHV